MKFYHGTSQKIWEKIKREKVLWGIPTTVFSHMGYIRRYTYLTPHIEIAKEYGSENSSSFVNGVLGTIYKDVERQDDE